MIAQLNEYDSLNKLFCSFTTPETLNDTLALINRKYSILFNKIFVLESPQSKELMCTYNIDSGNMTDSLMPNTILLHRKKEVNCLYSINTLNILIRTHNNGYLNKNFIIDWDNYKNCILLTSGENVRKLDTLIYKIVDFGKN